MQDGTDPKADAVLSTLIVMPSGRSAIARLNELAELNRQLKEPEVSEVVDIVRTVSATISRPYEQPGLGRMVRRLKSGVVGPGELQDWIEMLTSRIEERWKLPRSDTKVRCRFTF